MKKFAALLGPINETTRAKEAEFNELARILGDVVEFRLIDCTRAMDAVAKDCEGAVAIHPAAYRTLTTPQITELVSRTKTIKLVQAPSAGTDLYDKHALARLGVPVANHGGANAVAVAEIAVTLMVGVYRRLDLQIQSVKAGTWMEPVNALPETQFHTLVGKRIGLVGLGRIGSRLARRLQGWECEVVYHDILDFPKDYVQATGAKSVDLKTLYATSDIVSMHVPLEPTTRHMVSDEQFALMKPTAVFINTCRGPVVDEAALIRALQQKKIFGAGLDVTEIEPIKMDNPLLKMENVIILPHLATRAIESTINGKNFIVENISRVARGEAPTSVVAPV